MAAVDSQSRLQACVRMENGRDCAGSRTLRRCIFALVAGLALVGCRPTTTPDFHSPEPGARNEAIIDAAASKDRRAIPNLVLMLQSDDGATRLLAIRTLERLTGETLGYDHASGTEARRASIERWEEYVRSHETGRTWSGSR